MAMVDRKKMLPGVAWRHLFIVSDIINHCRYSPHSSPPVLIATHVQSNSVEPSIYPLYSC